MALTPADFKRPAGRLKEAWFSDTLDDLLAAYLTEAGTLTTDETAQAHWVYYRAFGALVDDLMIEPAKQREGDASEEFTKQQLAFFVQERDAALAQFDAAEASTPATPSSRFRRLVPTF